MTPKTKKIIIAGVVLLNLTLIFLFKLTSRNNFPFALPHYIVRSIDGRNSDLSAPGRAKLLCFVEPNDESVLDSILTIVQFLITNRIDNLDILLFTNNPEALLAKFPALNNLYLGNKNYTSVFQRKDRLNFYLYDREGLWIRQALPNLEPHQLIWWVSDALGHRLPSWSPAELLAVHERVFRLRYLSFLKRHVDSSNKSLFVFVFLDSICSSCQSGRVVDDINTLQEAIAEADFSIILPPEYDENDLANIKNSEKLGIEFIRSSKEITDYAGKCLRENLVSTVNGLTFVVNKDGEALFVTDLFDEHDRFLIDRLDALKGYLSSVKAGNYVK